MSRSRFADARTLASLFLLAVLLLQVTGHLSLPWVEALERQLGDVELALAAPRKADDRIVIVDIDDAALAAVGRWPWPRRHLADLIDRCFDHGALILGMDLILSEPDESSGLALLEDLSRNGPLQGDAQLAAALPGLRQQLDDDGRLAGALRRHPVVLGFHLVEEASGSGSEGASLPPPLMSAGALALPDWPGHGGNLEQLQEAAGQAGFLNTISDADGLTRRGLLLARHDGNLYGSLPLMLTQQLLGAGTPEALATNGVLQGLVLHTAQGPRFVGTGALADVVIPYRASEGAYKRVSAAALLDPATSPEQLHGALQGKIVLLGASAAGLMDRHPVPQQAAFVGVDAHASLLTGLLDGQLTHARSDEPALAAVLLMLLTGVLVTLLPQLSLPQAVLLNFALLAVLLVHHDWAWRAQHEAWPLAAPMLLLLGISALHGLLQGIEDGIARRRLQSLFGQYVPASRVAEMAREATRDSYTLQSRNAELTVLFADVRGFAGIAEQLRPAELAQLMNAHFTAMSDVISLHRGTLDKYIGDAVMAFWGAPQVDHDHARHAVLAAQAMLSRLAVLNQDLAARGLPQLSLHIGINTGTMVVGDLGSQSRRAYTVLGHSVNVAARLQELCGSRSVDILIGETTYAQAGLPCQSLGQTTLRGQQSALMIYSPID